ncbi:MAG: PPOX class F420-dependent oxidoreductase [Candidatus Promineifilaceae bacterium]
MTTLLEKGAAQYIALETFRKNGTAVSTPVWVVLDDKRLLVITGRDSWKVKRIRNNPHVRLAESDMRGKVEGTFAEGQARIIEDADAIAALNQRIIKKYGLLARFISFMAWFRARDRARVVIEIKELNELHGDGA